MVKFLMTGGYRYWVQVSTCDRVVDYRPVPIKSPQITRYLKWLINGDKPEFRSRLVSSQLNEIAEKIVRAQPCIWSIQLEPTEQFREASIKASKIEGYRNNLAKIRRCQFSPSPYPLFFDAAIIDGPPPATFFVWTEHIDF